MSDYIAAASLGCIMTTGGLAAILGNYTLRPEEWYLACIIILIKAIPALFSAAKRELRLERIYLALDSCDRQEELEILLDPEVDQSAFLEAACSAGHGSLTTVPILIFALEQTLDQQAPGWSERAEALLNSISMLADEESIPALRKMIHVKGIGINQPLRHAIRKIQPRSRLLMPTSTSLQETSSLLRYPAENHCAEARCFFLELSQMS